MVNCFNTTIAKLYYGNHCNYVLVYSYQEQIISMLGKINDKYSHMR